MSGLRIAGIGSALPDRVVTNAELEAMSGFPAARIRELFEIDERRWSRGVDQPDPPAGQRCSDLAAAASRQALARAGIQASELGAVFAVTTTPDSLNPPPDALIARNLGIAGVPTFSLQAPCTGLFRAAELASAMAPRLSGRPILIVAAETPSPFFRFGSGVATEQVLNSVLYADGAGAMVVTENSGNSTTPAIELIDLAINDDLREPGITFHGMLSARPPTADRFERADYLGHHDFRKVLRRGSKLAASAANRVMDRLGVSASDVRFFVTHQATGNLRRIAASFSLPPEKVPINIDRVGNTISASVLILLAELVAEDRISRGDLLILHTAESSTWSSAGMAIRW
jgi:3-oxoacyl-[acyl-carrier-protein] synthase-3